MSSSSSASLHSAVCTRHFNHSVLATVKELLARVSGATLCPTVTISKAGCDIYDRFSSKLSLSSESLHTCLELGTDSKLSQFLLDLLNSENQSTYRQAVHCLPAPHTDERS